MLELTRGLDAYHWAAARVRLHATPGHLTYLIGIPNAPPRDPFAARAFRSLGDVQIRDSSRHLF